MIRQNPVRLNHPDFLSRTSHNVRRTEPAWNAESITPASNLGFLNRLSRRQQNSGEVPLMSDSYISYSKRSRDADPKGGPDPETPGALRRCL